MKRVCALPQSFSVLLLPHPLPAATAPCGRSGPLACSLVGALCKREADASCGSVAQQPAVCCSCCAALGPRSSLPGGLLSCWLLAAPAKATWRAPGGELAPPDRAGAHTHAPEHTSLKLLGNTDFSSGPVDMRLFKAGAEAQCPMHLRPPSGLCAAQRDRAFVCGVRLCVPLPGCALTSAPPPPCSGLTRRFCGPVCRVTAASPHLLSKGHFYGDSISDRGAEQCATSVQGDCGKNARAVLTAHKHACRQAPPGATSWQRPSPGTSGRAVSHSPVRPSSATGAAKEADPNPAYLLNAPRLPSSAIRPTMVNKQTPVHPNRSRSGETICGSVGGGRRKTRPGWRDSVGAGPRLSRELGAAPGSAGTPTRGVGCCCRCLRRAVASHSASRPGK